MAANGLIIPKYPLQNSIQGTPFPVNFLSSARALLRFMTTQQQDHELPLSATYPWTVVFPDGDTELHRTLDSALESLDDACTLVSTPRKQA